MFAFTGSTACDVGLKNVPTSAAGGCARCRGGPSARLSLSGDPGGAQALPLHCKRPQFCGTASISLCCLLYLCFSPSVEDLSGSVHSGLEKSYQRHCSHVEVIPDGITSRHLAENRVYSGGGGSVPRSHGGEWLPCAPSSRLGAARCREGEREGRTPAGTFTYPGRAERRRGESAFVSPRGRGGAPEPILDAHPGRARFAAAVPGGGGGRALPGAAGLGRAEAVTQCRPQPIKGARRAAGWGSCGVAVALEVSRPDGAARNGAARNGTATRHGGEAATAVRCRGAAERGRAGTARSAGRAGPCGRRGRIRGEAVRPGVHPCRHLHLRRVPLEAALPHGDGAGARGRWVRGDGAELQGGRGARPSARRKLKGNPGGGKRRAPGRRGLSRCAGGVPRGVGAPPCRRRTAESPRRDVPGDGGTRRRVSVLNGRSGAPSLALRAAIPTGGDLSSVSGEVSRR